MEVFVTILIFIAAMAVAFLLFIGWVVVTIIKAVKRAFTRPSIAARQSIPTRDYSPAGTIRCPRENCRHWNPIPAQFCRRCGMNLVAEQMKLPERGRRRLMVRA